MAIGTVWLRLTIVRTTYSINQTNRMISNLRQEREQVQFKVAGLKSPRHLESLARGRFGLSQPNAEQVVHLKGDSIELQQAAPERKAAEKRVAAAPARAHSVKRARR
jgi:hypothetical protein